MADTYEDIINLPHHQSETRPHMPNSERAAMFSPFAALSGYGDAITETARLTDRRIELSEDEIQTLNEVLTLIHAHLAERPEVTVTYFVPDLRKDGGAYVTHTGHVKKIDEIEKTLVLTDKTMIPLGDILDISTAICSDMQD
ncbi:MAG: YolD-like family protein [Oscillospiraceae bacterium]|nr:YolD-like family protein [Oscillospiraceae bacterium]